MKTRPESTTRSRDHDVDWQELSDEELVMQCRQGRQAAWSTLVRRFQRLIYTIPRRARLPDQAAADVFQNTFSHLFEHIDRLQQPARVRAWLVTTARRETLKQLRISGVEVEAPSAIAGRRLDDDAPADDMDAVDIAHWAGAPGADLGDEERWHEVRTAVDRLEARCRQLIELLFLSDPEVPYAEIGSRLGMPLGSIGPTRARCLAQLRKLLAE
jgi:RNA polymerase sigma factor (sigma-70 family)